VNIILISRLLKSKGIIEYCKLAQSLKIKYPQLIFNLVGDYQYNSADSIDANTIESFSKYINFLGKRSDIKSLLKMSDIMIFPSNYPEGVPRVLLEGASMGLPLIAFKNPGSNEVVFDDVNGFLIDSDYQYSLQNSLLKILNDPILYNYFSNNSRKIAVKYFDLKIIASQYLKLYRSYLIS
jgi:glycosyltransferase involved in cell wall biosynthesis